jgi:hypothetical protein
MLAPAPVIRNGKAISRRDAGKQFSPIFAGKAFRWTIQLYCHSAKHAGGR